MQQVMRMFHEQLLHHKDFGSNELYRRPRRVDKLGIAGISATLVNNGRLEGAMFQAAFECFLGP